VDPMAPWLDYPASDPRSGRSNWRLDEATGQPVYIGPSPDAGPPPQPAYDPLSSAYTYAPPPYDPLSSGNPGTPPAEEPKTYVWADGSTWTQGDPVGTGTVTPVAIVDPPPLGAGPPPQPAYDPLSSGNPGYVPQPIGDVAMTGGGTYGPGTGATLGYGSGQSDFITPHIPLYDGMLAGGGSAPGSGAPAPLTGPPVIVGTDPATGAPIYDTGGAGGGSDPYGYGYDAGYGYGGGSSFPGADFGYGTDPLTGSPLLPNGQPFGSAERSGTTPYGFDPFLWAEVKNPMPPASPMRAQIMQAGGFAGPAWAPAPPPQPPGPMAYVRARLGMQEPGHTLEMKPPVPGFRFDGTPRSEPQEESKNFVPADQAGMFPPLPPTFPRRGY
jgi:hypothetical protein